MNNQFVKRYLVILATITGTFFACGLVIILLFRTYDVKHTFFNIINILKPFIYGFVIAYLLNFFSTFFEKHFTKLDCALGKRRHPGLVRMCAIFVSFALFFLLLFLLIFAILPQLVTSISGIINMIPDIVRSVQDWLQEKQQRGTNPEVLSVLTQLTNTLSSKLQNYLSTSLLPNMQTYLTELTSSFLNLINFLKNFGIGCIAAMYMLAGKEKFLMQGKLLLYSIFNETWANRILHEIRYTDQMFSGFITGKLLDSAIIGLICFAFTGAAKTPYALLVSVIIGVTNMIPFFGPYIGTIPSALLIFFISPAKCVVFVIFVIILQQVDGNIIGPKILGNKLGLSGFWVLFSVLVFSSLWGLVGMLVGLPVFAVIYDLIRRLVILGLTKRNQLKHLQEYQKME